jgi:predicted permease
MWKYVPVINVCVQILLAICLGGAFGITKVIRNKPVFIEQTVIWVFYCALPCLVIRGLGIGIDFYSKSFLWTYVFAFLLLRIITLVGAIFLATYQKSGQESAISLTAIYWLCSSWISTIILGIPILSALLQDSEMSLTYGLLASISSFIFQLPTMIVLLELDVYWKTQPSSREEISIDEGQREVPITNSTSSIRNNSLQRGCTLVFANPVVIAIVVSFALSLSLLGPTFLNPTSISFVESLGWIANTLEWFGACVSPISLFVMGVWMAVRIQDDGFKIHTTGLKALMISMIVKLILVPLVMVALAVGFGFSDEEGRAAVLIASLPISQASFSLGARYGIGEGLLSVNVAVGTLLMVPAVLIWNLALDSAGLFPIPYHDNDLSAGLL